MSPTPSRTLWAALALLVAGPAAAQAPQPAAAESAGTLEAIGAQRCGNRATVQVEFLAPEEASVVANAAVAGTSGAATATATLALDGKDCGGSECSFRAAKGQRYRLVATRVEGRTGDLCVSVTRP